MTRERLAAGAGLALGAAALAALHAWHGLSYWDYSEGVYALTSRLLGHGHSLYGDVVAAQPPGVLVLGAGALAVHDSLDWLRLAVGLAGLLGGAVAGWAVWRMTGNAVAAALTPALFLLTPWAVHEHGALTPESFGGPLLLGAAILLARPRSVAAGALLAGFALLLKLSFVLPVAAIVLAAPQRRRAALWALATVAAGALVATAVFGPDLWKDTVVAQLAIGRDTLRHVGQKWAQEAWSLAGLALAAALAWRLRGQALARMLLALAGGFMLTALTNVKIGTGLNVAVPIEAALVPLAVAAVTLRGRPALLAAAGIAFTLVQTASLLAVSPTATPFLYPSSKRGAWGELLSDAAVRSKVAVIRRECPPAQPYAGPPFLAMAAGRPVPQDQPDGFLTGYSPTFRALHERIVTTRPVCPP
jgi:hypothetical protein